MNRRFFFLFLAFTALTGCRTQQASLQGNALNPEIAITPSGNLLVRGEFEEMADLSRIIRKARIDSDDTIYVQVQGDLTHPGTQRAMQEVGGQIVAARHSIFVFVTEREASATVKTDAHTPPTPVIRPNAADPVSSEPNNVLNTIESGGLAVPDQPRSLIQPQERRQDAAPLGSRANPRPAKPRRAQPRPSRYARPY